MRRHKVDAALLVVAVVAGAVVAVILRGYAHTVGDRLHADFWPLDNSRVGTNVLAGFLQVAIAAAVAAVLYPPMRRWVTAELDRLHAKADHTADLLHHIIEHSDHIPNDDPLGRAWHDRRPPRGR